MKKIVENICSLIKVKTFVTFAIVAVFVALAVRGDISPEQVTTMAGMVVSFYFGTQSEKRSGS